MNEKKDGIKKITDEIKITQAPAYLIGLKTKASGAWEMKFETQENMSPEVINYFSKKRDNLGYLTYMAREVKADDLIEIPDVEASPKGKTPSERLRNVIFIFYKNNKKPDSKETFDNYYKRMMEKNIDEWKEKLNG